ncbi:MAG TPA: ABC transporter ATP-binding protein [Anaerolineales bacterium]|nr:ABC transporter ATP-binding protein [Anaerolineales bacterium]
MTLSISVENLSKQYRLGVIGNRTLYEDINRWWARVRGLPDPLEKIGEVDHGNRANGLLWALRDVSFQLEQGEVLGVIGRNGAGKSTLLKILSRVTGPTSGQIKLRGRIASLLEVGTGFHPELTGRENIYLNGTILGMSRGEIAKKFDEIVSFSEVEKFVDTPVKRYSSGMYVRLAFAVAAHLDPEIMVVDEVLAVGDAAFQRKCLGKLSENAGEGRTVLFVSHNMAAINRLCSRAILLDRGLMIADGPAAEITAKYLSGAAEEDGIRNWNPDEAPGTDEVRLMGISISGNNGVSKSVFEVSDEIFIRLDYRVGVPNTRFRCAMVFSTQGVTVFSTIEPYELERKEIGLYSSVLRIPAHLLAESEYSINVSAFTSAGSKKHYISLRNVLHFQIYDSMTTPSARGDYTQNLAGVIRPRLDWKSAEKRIDS